MKTTDTLRIGENVYEYEWRRKPIKTLNLRVRPDGSLYVSSPPFVSKKEVERFLQERRLFIEKASMRGLTLADGTSVHIFGKEMPLFIEPPQDTSVLTPVEKRIPPFPLTNFGKG